MPPKLNRHWRLAARPVGMIKESDFEWRDEPVPGPYNFANILRKRARVEEFIVFNSMHRANAANPKTRGDFAAYNMSTIMFFAGRTRYT